MRETLKVEKRNSAWASKRNLSHSYLSISTRFFPHLIEELKGYARGADVAFEDLWVLSLEDELSETKYDKCTSIITNGGLLIAHNEDWDASAQDDICLLKKTIQDLTVFGLFYLHTLGGNAISVNSHGIVQAINTLTHTDYQMGVPKNIVARWLSDTPSPEHHYKELIEIPRSSGYHHGLAKIDGSLWSIECSAQKQILTKPTPPFVHTNHFLTKLCQLEADENGSGTFNRFNRAASVASDPMSVDRIRELTSDTSGGLTSNIFNETTIARTIIDLEQMMALIWLRREAKKGWISYPLDFIRLH